jgi:hypothetical protein
VESREISVRIEICQYVKVRQDARRIRSPKLDAYGFSLTGLRSDSEVPKETPGISRDQKRREMATLQIRCRGVHDLSTQIVYVQDIAITIQDEISNGYEMKRRVSHAGRGHCRMF